MSLRSWDGKLLACLQDTLTLDEPSSTFVWMKGPSLVAAIGGGEEKSSDEKGVSFSVPSKAGERWLFSRKDGSLFVGQKATRVKEREQLEKKRGEGASSASSTTSKKKNQKDAEGEGGTVEAAAPVASGMDAAEEESLVTSEWHVVRTPLKWQTRLQSLCAEVELGSSSQTKDELMTIFM